MLEFPPTQHEPVNVVIFCPPSFKEEVKNYLRKVGAEAIEEVDGLTFFTPMEKAQPTAGIIGQTSEEPEGKVVATVDSCQVSDLRKMVEANHPYESFAFEVYPQRESRLPTYLGTLKLRVNTTHAEFAIEVLSKLGAGEIGEYKDCFFIFHDKNKSVWIETVCAANLLEEEIVEKGELELDGIKIKVERLLDNPVACGRKAKS